MGICSNRSDPGNAFAVFGNIEPKITCETLLDLFFRVILKEVCPGLGRKLPDNEFLGQRAHELTDFGRVRQGSEANYWTFHLWLTARFPVTGWRRPAYAQHG